MYILNTTSEKQSFQVFGSWFTLNPGQVKNFAKDGMGEFITQKKRYLGLVELPESFEDPAFKETEEG